MDTKFCKSSPEREAWAVSLCFASATIMSLEALRPGSCASFGMSADQYFSIGAIIASLSTFFGAFVLMRSWGKLVAVKPS